MPPLDLPTPGSDTGTWGSKLNTALTDVDARASDEAVAGWVDDSASDTRAALSATIAGQAVPHSAIDYSTAKKSAFSFGGSGGQGTTTSFTDVAHRLPLGLPVTTTRWRLHISNRDYRNGGSAGTSQIDGLGCWVGEHALDANGEWTGGFVESAPAQAFGAWQVGPTASHEFISEWVTDVAKQFTAHKPHMISLGWTSAAGVPKVRGIGACYLAGTMSAQAGRQAAFGGSFISNTSILDIWIEYEHAGANPVGIVLGDSLSEGHSSGKGQCGSWPFQHSLLNGETMISNAYSGATTANFTDPAGNKWSRYDGITPAFTVIELGGNDIGNVVALATIQANLRTIIANLRTKYGRQLPIYVGTVMPRGWTATQEADRVALNSWLRNLPANVSGCFDFDKAVQNPSAVASLDAEFNSGDGTHLTTSGYGRMARSVPGRLTRF